MIFGGFLEHFDNQIYGGVFAPESPLSNEKGFRTDVIEALKELKVGIVRWPGGCFVDSYHWRNGVGPQRKPHGDFRWGVIEPNSFGTHEFVEFCQLIGAEPYICLNGLADPQENVDWITYCNATEGELAEKRKKNGYPEPLNVKYWSVGNERYDHAYIHRVRDTAKTIKQLYPEVRMLCSGSQGAAGTRMPPVHRYLMEQAGEYLDYVSVHNYWLNRGRNLPRYDYLSRISRSEMPGQYIEIVANSLRKLGKERIKIAFDEWNLQAWQHPGFPRHKVTDYDDPKVIELVELRREQNDRADQYTIADALFASSFLNACLRNAKTVKMANIAPLVNTRGPLYAHAGGIVKRPHFHTLALYANRLQDYVVPTSVAGGYLTEDYAYGFKVDPVSTIDALVTANIAGSRWTVVLTNRHPSQEISCTLDINGVELKGAYTATILTADSTDTYNSIEKPDRVTPRETQLSFADNSTTLPPHSLVVMDIERR
jgi:alpha-N-arabinofuranosidase